MPKDSYTMLASLTIYASADDFMGSGEIERVHMPTIAGRSDRKYACLVMLVVVYSSLGVPTHHCGCWANDI